MKPAPFAYARPRTVEEVLALLTKHGDDAKVLGGGQSLIPLLNMRLARPSVLIDLADVADLSGISANGAVAIGAMTRHAEAEHSRDVAGALPIIPAALRHVGHAAIRARGTIGGSIAHADPAAELPVLFLALDGEAVIASPRGERVVAAQDFFSTYFTTAVEDDELLVQVRLPQMREDQRWAFTEVARRHGDFALVGAAVVLTLDGRGPDATIADARVALSGVADTPIRVATAESALVGAAIRDGSAFIAAAEATAAELEPEGDIHASASYRKEVAATLVRRALGEAIERKERS